jgi:hypothetical protein
MPGRCEPPKAQEAARATSHDLGQTEAKNEARHEEQLRHMEGGEVDRSVSTKSADLGQREAKNEAQHEEQLRHMEDGKPYRTAQRTKPKKRL